MCGLGALPVKMPSRTGTGPVLVHDGMFTWIDHATSINWYWPFSLWWLPHHHRKCITRATAPQPYSKNWSFHGPLTRYMKLRLAHAPRMPGTFSPSLQSFSNPDMQHGTCVTHVPWSSTSGFLSNRWRGKLSRHSRRMHNLKFYVSGKRPMDYLQVKSLQSEITK